MLSELRVRGLGVLDGVEVSFAPGLNVLTGETGAGKTLLVTSLALLCGARAEGRLVRPGAGEAVVEGVLRPPEPLAAVLEGFTIEDGELSVVRRLQADGRSRAWVGGTLVPASLLSEVVGALVEIHGQGEGFALARPAVQLEALDAFGGTEALRQAWAAALARLRQARRELEELERSERERAREAEVLAAQVEEIERARIDPETDEELGGILSRLEHAERLGEIAAEAAALSGPEGAAAALGQAAKLLGEAARLDPAAAEQARRAGALAAEAADLATCVRRWGEGLDADPSRLAELRERAALLGRLRRKYGATLAEVLAFAAQARRRLADLESAPQRMAELRSAVQAARAEAEAAGAQLSARRRAAADELARLVAAELPALALPQARFEVCIAAAPPSESGCDRVEFRFSADPSAPPGPLGKVASGGELSRVMIALTLALASAHRRGVLVFDEADAGVGGAAALELARRLARLGRTHQVLVVTHLPQIAAFADHHLALRRRGGRVRVEALQGPERLAEISRMLAGLDSSHTARAHAAELLALAAAERSAEERRRGRVVTQG